MSEVRHRGTPEQHAELDAEYQAMLQHGESAESLSHDQTILELWGQEKLYLSHYGQRYPLLVNIQAPRAEELVGTADDMPEVPKEAFEYQKRLLDVCEILTGLPPTSISESMAKSLAEDEAVRSAWALGEYMSTGCENCGRMRVCACPNGKHRCEKCNWCPEDQAYSPNV